MVEMKAWSKSNANKASLLLVLLPAIIVAAYSLLTDPAVAGKIPARFVVAGTAILAALYATIRNWTAKDITRGKWIVPLVSAAVGALMAIFPIPPASVGIAPPAAPTSDVLVDTSPLDILAPAPTSGPQAPAPIVEAGSVPLTDIPVQTGPTSTPGP